MDALGEAASGFAGEVQSVLADVLPLECELLVVAEELNGRYVIRPHVGGQGGANVPLHVGQVRVGGLAPFFRCQWDHKGKYLAVEESQFALNWGVIKDPLLRLHFRRDPRSTPASHWHVHAERGALDKGPDPQRQCKQCDREYRAARDRRERAGPTPSPHPPS